MKNSVHDSHIKPLSELDREFPCGAWNERKYRLVYNYKFTGKKVFVIILNLPSVKMKQWRIFFTKSYVLKYLISLENKNY